MNCPKCRTPMIMHVQIGISCPSEFEGKISKSMIIKKKTKIEFANWDTASYDCPVCNYHHSRLGNYVTKMEDKNAELETKVQELETKIQSLQTDGVDANI